MKLSRIEWAVIIITFLGALLRFWNIGFQWMNYDEQFSLMFARPELSYGYIFAEALVHDYTPPIYYMFSHTSMLIFGQNATAIRIPSAIAGVLFIPIMYFVGKEYKDELFGLLIAGFSAIYYNAVFYSKYGRAYSMEFVFFSIAFYFFMRVLKGDKRSGVWFGVFALCSLWTHLYSVIPIGIMILYLLWERKALDGIGIIIPGSLPLLFYVMPLFTTRSNEVGGNFGATPFEILTLMPLDIFAFSAFLIVPIIIYSLWVHRSERILRIITVVALITWASMFVISLKTPVILHYAIFLVPMLLIPFILPFYNIIKNDEVYFHHLMVIMVIVLLEAIQIAALAVAQRAWHF